MNYAGAGLILLSSDLAHVLLVQDARSGKWGFPKGHREPIDSSDLACAIRECREETGLKEEDYIVHNESFKISKGGAAYLFRYAIIKQNAVSLSMGPAYEIASMEWVPIQKLLEAQNVLDGNKYLRTWIADIQSSASKKAVYIFKQLLGLGLTPLQETVSPSNIVART